MNPAAVRCRLCGSSSMAEAVAGQCPRCLIGVVLSADDELAPARSGIEPAWRVFGDYLLGRQIGAGGMGVVYEARRLEDGRLYALKLIRDFHVVSPALLRRFTIEAEAVARLDHPHIVRIHDVGEHEGHPFFCMDLVEGESLGARIGLAGRMAPLEAARLLIPVARAVQHAHGRGVLHRDLKPANILIDARGEPHLTDFGLAKILRHDADEQGPPALTSTGAPGTPSYMAPEQIAGVEAGAASDIYGLGAVLYALLTGRPPFQGATPLELFRQITEQEPERPGALNPSVPPALETICLKCLEKNPRDRYATAQALADDLENCATGRAIRARPAGVVHRGRAWMRRNPVGAALMASLSLGLFIAIALLKIVNDQRLEMELDRDQTFDEGMQKISQLWRDPATRSVTVSARELAILAGRSPAESRGAKHELTLGVSADDGPASVAQRYARLLGGFQEGMQRELGGKTVFHLRLLKRFHQNEGTLARGEADLLVLSAVEFLRAEKAAPGVAIIARVNSSREGVIFARAGLGVTRLPDLRGRSLALPDANLPLNSWAKMRLVEAGLRGAEFVAWTNIADQGLESGQTVVSTAECVDRVLRGEWDAGVTHRGSFERYRHLGLVELDAFPDTPNLLAARAGLDPKLVEALRNVLRPAADTRGWPDARFVADDRPGVSTNASLAAFREAFEKAGRF